MPLRPPRRTMSKDKAIADDDEEDEKEEADVNEAAEEG